MLLTREKIVRIIRKTEGEIGPETAADEILAVLDAQEPEWADHLFPDEEQLRHRKAAFLARVVKYLSTRTEGEGGWVPVTRDDMDDFRAMATELRDLRFALDGDKDPTIEIALVNRIEGRMHTFYEPYAPDLRERETPPTPQEMARYRDGILATATHMISNAEHMLNIMRNRMSRDQTDMAKQRVEEDALLVFKAILPHVTFDGTKAGYLKVLEQFGKNSTVTKEARKLLGDSIVHSTVVASAEMDAALDAGDMELAAKLITSGQELWFGGAFEAQRTRFNETCYQARRTARLATPRQSVPEWSNQFISDVLLSEEPKCTNP